MKGQYLLAYIFTQNGKTGVGSVDMTLEPSQSITPKVIQDAIRTIQENCEYDSVVPLSWCRYEQPSLGYQSRFIRRRGDLT